MRHPFTWLSARYRCVVLVLLFSGTAALAAQLTMLDCPLKKKVCCGIVAFELCWTAERAGEILEAWQALEEVVKRQTHLDFGFLVLYPLALSLACAMLAERGGRLAGAGRALSWAVLAAAPLDAVENLALLHMLEHGATALQAGIAGGCATLKFTLVILTALYLVSHAVREFVAVLKRRRAGRAPG